VPTYLNYVGLLPRVSSHLNMAAIYFQGRYVQHTTTKLRDVTLQTSVLFIVTLKTSNVTAYSQLIYLLATLSCECSIIQSVPRYLRRTSVRSYRVFHDISVELQFDCTECSTISPSNFSSIIQSVPRYLRRTSGFLIIDLF
jgi:hypothetical protein